MARRGADLYAKTAAKPPLSPPALVFPVAWSVLYALMGVGAARVWMTPPSPRRTRALVLFGVQLAFRACDKPAAWLQVPYLLWLTFAAYLNFGVWALN